MADWDGGLIMLNRIVFGILFIMVICIFAVRKAIRARKAKKDIDISRTGEHVKISGVVAAITAAVNNYQNENP